MVATKAAEHLQSLVRRLLDAESADDKAAIYQEAKQWGFDVPALKRVMRFAKMDKADAQEAWAVLELYMLSTVLA